RPGPEIELADSHQSCDAAKEFPMKRFLHTILAPLWNKHGKGGARSRFKPKQVCLAMEALEDRMVPTVIFNPVFGSDNVLKLPDIGLQNPAVTLIFSGSSWNATNEQPLRDAMQRILSGPYLSKLTQYHSDGQAHLSGISWTSSSSLGLLPGSSV